MVRRLPAPIHTMYAELVERCGIAQLAQDFPVNGNFFTKTVKGRDYWYFKETTGGRRDRYVGADTPEVRRRIEEHRKAKDSFRQRRTMVTSLRRAGLQGPDAMTGRVLEALADAGVFRVRAMVVGTAAYQIYSSLLGVVLSNRNSRTDDLDLAQFDSVSIGVSDAVEVPLGEILKRVDPRFAPIPDAMDGRHATRYGIGDEYRVDLLTPNRGPDSDRPVHLPSIRAEAQPMSFLDFLIYQEIPAAVLYGGGILINVPAPERYALHKLLVSRLRIETRQSQEKALKDLKQAGELVAVLADQRPYELRSLWDEMIDRGPKWRQMAIEAVGLLDHATESTVAREKLQQIVGEIETPRP